MDSADSLMSFHDQPFNEKPLTNAVLVDSWEAV